MDGELDHLEISMRLFFQTLKSPIMWSKVYKTYNIDVDRPTAGILLLLANCEKNESRVQDLANLLNIEAPSVTRKTQDMENAGLITRTHDEKDRRVTKVGLTGHGVDLAKDIKQARRDIFTKALLDFSEEERQNFIKLFDEFSQNLNKVMND